MASISSSVRRQIRNLLLVFFCAVGMAFLFSVFLIYNYGPSGRYLVRNVLLSPDLLTTLAYNDTNSKTGSSSRFVFDGIEYSFYDSKEKQMKYLQIDLELYRQFYNLVDGDKSILEIPHEILAAFTQEEMPSLVIKVRTESHAPWQDETKEFQKVNFVAEGDHYRIKLHEERSAEMWVYFQHADIYHSTLKLFVPQLP